MPFKASGNTYHCTVSDLQRLDSVQSQLSGAFAHEEAGSSSGSTVDFPSAVNSRERGCGVGDDTCHTDVVGFLGDALEGEGFADGALQQCVSQQSVETRLCEHSRYGIQLCHMTSTYQV